MVNDESSRGCLRIAIASYDARFFRICQNYISCLDRDAFRCDIYQSGKELLAALDRGFPYRAVLLDNALSDMDAPAFCSQLQQMSPNCRPWLLLVPACDVDELCRFIREEGGQQPESDTVHKMKLSSLNSLLFDLQSMLQSQAAPTDSDAALVRLLICWGEAPGALGSQYLRECIAQALRCDPHFAIRKDVLMVVGERHKVSVTAVDSGIRRLIRSLNALNKPAWQSFKRRHCSPHQHLTTGKFIYAVRDELLMPPQDPAEQPLSEGDLQTHEREFQPV